MCIRDRFNGKGVFVRKIIELLTAVFVKTCANSVDFLIFFDFLLKTNRHDETFRCSSMHLEGLKITTSTCGITPVSYPHLDVYKRQ